MHCTGGQPFQMKSTGHTLPSGKLTSQRRMFTPASAPASIARCVASGSISPGHLTERAVLAEVGETPVLAIDENPCTFGVAAVVCARADAPAMALGALATVSLSAHSGENPPLHRPCHGVNDACVVLLLTTAVQRSFNSTIGAEGMRNSSVRKFWYKKSLDMWHGDTAWRDALVVVENGGFDEWHREYPSFEVLTFVHTRAQQRLFCEGNFPIYDVSPYASGQHELALPPG